MRIVRFALAALATLAAAPAPARDDDDFGRGSQMRRGEWSEHHMRRDRDRGHWGMGVDCGALRRACAQKNETGEEGMGNCARYRRMCR